jgi:hypothetical protein
MTTPPKFVFLSTMRIATIFIIGNAEGDMTLLVISLFGF